METSILEDNLQIEYNRQLANSWLQWFQPSSKTLTSKTYAKPAASIQFTTLLYLKCFICHIQIIQIWIALRYFIGVSVQCAMLVDILYTVTCALFIGCWLGSQSPKFKIFDCRVYGWLWANHSLLAQIISQFWWWNEKRGDPVPWVSEKRI